MLLNTHTSMSCMLQWYMCTLKPFASWSTCKHEQKHTHIFLTTRRITHACSRFPSLAPSWYAQEQYTVTATHCNTLHYSATHCNTHVRAFHHSLRHGTHKDTTRFTLQHTATHCNTLHHSATLCNALQRTAYTHTNITQLSCPLSTSTHLCTYTPDHIYSHT